MKKKTNCRRLIVTLATLVVTVIATIVLFCTDQIAGWVAQMTAALALFRLVFLFGWGVARNGKGWRA